MTLPPEYEPPRASGDRGDKPQVIVVCTGRGTHPEALLGSLAVIESAVVANAYNMSAHAERRKDESVWIDDVGNIHLRCPRCRRHVPWKQANACAVIESFWSEQVAALDLSQVS